MKKLLTKVKLNGRGMAAAALATLGVGSALAADPNDYTTAITAFKTDWQTVLTTNGPALLGVLVVGIGFAFVWRMIRRAGKSI